MALDLAETPCVDCHSAVTIDPAVDGDTRWRCGRCARTPLAIAALDHATRHAARRSHR